MLEQTIERQKLIRMIDLSDLMYLKTKCLLKLHSSKSASALFVISLVGICTYLHRKAYTIVSVIKARQERPQPTISVTDGTPEYSIACEKSSSERFSNPRTTNKSPFQCLVIKHITGYLLIAARLFLLPKFRGLKDKLFGGSVIHLYPPFNLPFTLFFFI